MGDKEQQNHGNIKETLKPKNQKLLTQIKP